MNIIPLITNFIRSIVFWLLVILWLPIIAFLWTVATIMHWFILRRLRREADQTTEQHP